MKRLSCPLHKFISCGFFQWKVSVMQSTNTRNSDQWSIRRYFCPGSALDMSWAPTDPPLSEKERRRGEQAPVDGGEEGGSDAEADHGIPFDVYATCLLWTTGHSTIALAFPCYPL